MGRIDKKSRRLKRKARVRGKVYGTPDRPRLTVSRSLKNTFAQIIDDDRMVTLVAASSLTREIADKLAGKNKTEKAVLIGEEIARRALEKGIKTIAFDRNGYLFHGRVRALAEAARKSGLEF
jgi:large subunit ribosomal protein L18